MKEVNKKEETLYIVMPAYNEESNIEGVIKQWYPLLKLGSKDSKLIVADSGSTDKTNKILTNLKKKYSQLEIVSDSLKQHGPKVIYLYDYAIKNGADWVFQTDSDGQTNPDEFKEFWNLRKEYDAILGNRTVRGDGKSRAFVEKVVCFLVKIFFKVKVSDANAPFRLMKTDVIKKYLYKLPLDYNLPNIMITTYLAYYKENICFKEISFKPRQGGVNSINIPKICKIGYNALKDFNRFRKELKSEEY